ncbi:tRNA dimethylallyltransferase [Catalinimonas alkaloidigena]|uniref:tRNA (adenosine(37)-N6)-dimethylallyltransferase MiaA n=1 Tax=Catalinimonas alkaloidigena TaxID=1075417 RepID=UPI00240601F7|nr:tRNA (adenosine(37)-N6)-dimethylallyltransferase MiaA [Catalinimonas alkaloidigena]MDF9797702.1 tRNA dimethylallyltransferase [Catalinimonas alkaloidigena]
MIAKNTPTLIILLGPTAVGKTSIAIELGMWLSTSIVSTDSRQFYKEMNIGTAKPSPEELNKVTHHLVDFLSVKDPYDVKKFEEDALNCLSTIFQHKKCAIATGGSGLFVKTLCEGIDPMPDIPEKIRNNLQQRLEEKGLENLLSELLEVDPEYYSEVDLYNHRRVLRALEVYHACGKPYSSYRKQQLSRVNRPFEIVKIGLNRDRKELYERINQRVDQMVNEGLFAEVDSLVDFQEHNALQTVGYQEVFPFLRGDYGQEEAIRLIKRNTRRFAKRQLTWFRKDAEVKWFQLSGREEDALQEIKNYLKIRLSTGA